RVRILKEVGPPLGSGTVPYPINAVTIEYSVSSIGSKDSERRVVGLFSYLPNLFDSEIERILDRYHIPRDSYRIRPCTTPIFSFSEHESYAHQRLLRLVGHIFARSEPKVWVTGPYLRTPMSSAEVDYQSAREEGRRKSPPKDVSKKNKI